MIRSSTDYIVVHCSATSPDMDIGVRDIDLWHKERGWSGAGYHDVIRRSGKLEYGRGENEVGAHVKGYNEKSVGICLVGGIDYNGRPQDNFTEAQYHTLKRSLTFFKVLFPDALIVGHKDLDDKKDCPCFDIQDWVKQEGL